MIARSHPDASPEEPADLAQRAVREGRTLVIDDRPRRGGHRDPGQPVAKSEY